MYIYVNIYVFICVCLFYNKTVDASKNIFLQDCIIQALNLERN